MTIEEQLRERLRKVEALYLGGATAGERLAAEAAAARLKAKLEEASRIDRPEEMKLSFPDSWSVRLFIALAGAMASNLTVIRGSATPRSW